MSTVTELKPVQGCMRVAFDDAPSLRIRKCHFAKLPLKEGDATVTHWRIDERHSNSFAAWKRMGSPPQPTAEQVVELERAGKLAALRPAERVAVKEGAAAVKFELPLLW